MLGVDNNGLQRANTLMENNWFTIVCKVLTIKRYATNTAIAANMRGKQDNGTT